MPSETGPEKPKFDRTHWIFVIALVLTLALDVFTGVQYSRIRKEADRLVVQLKHSRKTYHELSEKSERDKRDLKFQIDRLKKENELMRLEFQKAQLEMNTAMEEMTYLEDMVIHKTREIEKLKKTPVVIPTMEAGAPSPDKDEEIRRLTEQNQMLREKLERLYKTTSDKLGEINVARIALEDTVAAARKKVDDEWNTVNLGSISVGKPAAERPKPTGKPKTEGRVLAINEDHGFVVVDLGKVDLINQDSQLFVMKDGQMVATLGVLEIRDVMSACNIKELREGKKILLNDPVYLKKT